MLVRTLSALAAFALVTPIGLAQNAAPLTEDQLIEILQDRQQSRDIERGARPVCDPSAHRGFLVFQDRRACERNDEDTIIVREEERSSHVPSSHHPRVELSYFDPVSSITEHNGIRTQSIRYERGHLANPQNLEDLQEEIRRSARRVCDSDRGLGASASRQERVCIETAMDHAMAQIALAE